ncbi:glutaredoxin family protein [Jatrophihabitans sp. YIM 134969]
MSRWLPRRRQPVAPPAEHEVTVVTREGCHLCETAEADVRVLAAELGFRVAVRDLDADVAADDRARWADLVPVLLVDGVEHGYWRVEPDRLRAAVGAR